MYKANVNNCLLVCHKRQHNEWRERGWPDLLAKRRIIQYPTVLASYSSHDVWLLTKSYEYGCQFIYHRRKRVKTGSWAQVPHIYHVPWPPGLFLFYPFSFQKPHEACFGFLKLLSKASTITLLCDSHSSYLLLNSFVWWHINAQLFWLAWVTPLFYRVIFLPVPGSGSRIDSSFLVVPGPILRRPQTRSQSQVPF